MAQHKLVNDIDLDTAIDLVNDLSFYVHETATFGTTTSGKNFREYVNTITDLLKSMQNEPD